MGFLHALTALSTLVVVAAPALAQPTTASASTTHSVEPCAQVSSRISSSLAAAPSASAFEIPAQLARDCSLSVSIVREDALNLVDSLSAWLQYQTTLAYLKNPPEGYLMNSVDLLGGLVEIRNRVANGNYTKEVLFQDDISSLVASAHDGHLAYVPDMLTIFAYKRTIGQLLSVSKDGKSVPEIYAYNDMAQAQNSTLSWTSSPLSMIDGQDALDWLSYQALNTTTSSQDPDAAWNGLFFELTNPLGAFSYAYQSYPGVSNNITFANGTSKLFPIVAGTSHDFTNVIDGKSFYDKFLNATVKMEADAAAAAATTTTTTTAAATTTTTSSTVEPTPQPSGLNPDFSMPGFPEPAMADSDSTLAGYFLSAPGLESTAVLSVFSFDPTDTQSFIDTLTNFLDECRRLKKTHLIIDVSGNGGGNILLAFETFKQLFPTVDPYLTSSRRATPQLEILTEFTTKSAQAVRKNLDDFEDAGGDGDFDVSDVDDAAGKRYTSFQDYWHPFDTHNDSFTPLASYNLSNNVASEITDGLVVSGYGNNTRLSPQPFASKNVILVTDGQCASSCHSFSHMLKWQGKVKTVAVGGRPQTDGQPMQYVGGVKGSEVTYLSGVLDTINQLYDEADDATLKRANQTGLKTLQDLGLYLLYRSADPASSELASVNFDNFIGQYDSSYTPMQFRYEAADCRVWYSLDMAFDITAVWRRAAREAFAIGPNATDVFATCVDGSTNAPSSLSGNATLYDDGTVANVTTFLPSTFKSSSSSDSGSDSTTSKAETSAAGSVRQEQTLTFFGLLIFLASFLMM